MNASPSWISGTAWFTGATVLLVVAIWLWEHTNKWHWGIRLGLSLLVVCVVSLAAYSPIMDQYRKENKPSVKVTPESFPLSGEGRSYKTDLVVTNETNMPLFQVVVELSSESAGGDFSYEVDKNPDAMIVGPISTDALALYGTDPKTGRKLVTLQFYEILPSKPRHIFISGKKATEKNRGHAEVAHFAYEPPETFQK